MEGDAAGSGKRLLRLLPLAVFGLAVIGVLMSGVWRHLSLDELGARRQVLKGFVRAHPFQSVAFYIAAYCMVVALSIPGALMMTLTGGFLFGAWVGGAAAAVGVASGAMIMFLVAHTALGDAIRQHAAPDGLIRKIEDGVRRNAFTTILFLRLMPAAPIWLVNIAAAFVRTPLWVYGLATVIGITPSCLIYASIGAGLDRVFEAGGHPRLLTLLRPETFAALTALAVLALAPIAYKVWRSRR